MKKTSTIFILMITLLLLAACSGNNGQANTPTESADNTDSGDEIVDTGGEPAVCTAQSQKLPDFVDETDFPTGALEDYSVTIVIYNDFACESCVTMAEVVAKALELYPGDIRVVYRYFPVLHGENDNGVVAAKAAEAAGLQGKFWEMHNILFTTQETWIDMDSSTFSEFIWAQVAELDLDVEQFDADVNSDEINEKIAANYDEALSYAAEPPVVMVNGTVTPLYISTVGDFFVWLESLMIPYGRHLNTKQFSECPAMMIDQDKNYTATLHTEKGDVVMSLYPDVAPMAVNSFVFLSENDYYDNTPFYAVIEGFVAQAGDPSGTGWGAPGYLFGLETSPDLTFERPYMVAMANSGQDTNNSQFFITYSPLSYLNGQYTIFGEVLDGVDVLKSLTSRNPEENPLAPLNDYILDVTIEEK